MAQITLNSSGVASSGSLLLQTNGTTTQATVDTSGNLGLGVTPTAWSGGSKVLALFATGNNLAGSTNDIILSTNANYVSGTGWTYGSSNPASYYEQYNGTHAWFKAASGTAGNAITFTQAMTLDASGNLGIGTSSPATKLNVANGAIRLTDGYELGWGDNSTYLVGNSSSDVMQFITNSSERARITSNGYFKASNTGTYISSTGAYHELSSDSSAAYAVYIRSTPSATGSFGINLSYPNRAPNDTGNDFITCSDSAATRFIARSNGGIANYSANNVNLSDERTKTDIQDAGGYLAKICAIPVRTFKYKDQTDDLLNLGCIAQEVEAVAPELVDVSGFGETPEDGVPLKAIYQTDLQYALMKCIQEQQAIITQLQADVAALKGQA